MRRPPSWLTAVILAVRPVAAPPMRRWPTSTLTTGGRLTVDAVPRTHTCGLLHTSTGPIAHCRGVDPSYGGAALAATATVSRATIHPIRGPSTSANLRP